MSTKIKDFKVGDKVTPIHLPLSGKRTCWESDLRDSGFDALPQNEKFGVVTEWKKRPGILVKFPGMDNEQVIFNDEVKLLTG